MLVWTRTYVAWGVWGRVSTPVRECVFVRERYPEVPTPAGTSTWLPPSNDPTGSISGTGPESGGPSESRLPPAPNGSPTAHVVGLRCLVFYLRLG